MNNLIIRSIDVILLAFFMYAAVVQYNDPDPALWIIAYGSAALGCALYLIGRFPTRLGILVSGACLLGALYLLMQDIAPGGFWDPTGREMVGIREPGREMVGLFIVAGWTGLLTWRARRERQDAVDVKV